MLVQKCFHPILSNVDVKRVNTADLQYRQKLISEKTTLFSCRQIDDPPFLASPYENKYDMGGAISKTEVRIFLIKI